MRDLRSFLCQMLHFQVELLVPPTSGQIPGRPIEYLACYISGVLVVELDLSQTSGGE